MKIPSTLNWIQSFFSFFWSKLIPIKSQPNLLFYFLLVCFSYYLYLFNSFYCKQTNWHIFSFTFYVDNSNYAQKFGHLNLWIDKIIGYSEATNMIKELAVIKNNSNWFGWDVFGINLVWMISSCPTIWSSLILPRCKLYQLYVDEFYQN